MEEEIKQTLRDPNTGELKTQLDLDEKPIFKKLESEKKKEEKNGKQ